MMYQVQSNKEMFDIHPLRFFFLSMQKPEDLINQCISGNVRVQISRLIGDP